MILANTIATVLKYITCSIENRIRENDNILSPHILKTPGAPQATVNPRGKHDEGNAPIADEWHEEKKALCYRHELESVGKW